jgi:hypothetical protein
VFRILESPLLPGERRWKKKKMQTAETGGVELLDLALALTEDSAFLQIKARPRKRVKRPDEMIVINSKFEGRGHVL